MIFYAADDAIQPEVSPASMISLSHKSAAVAISMVKRFK
jgi:hypothetical protein